MEKILDVNVNQIMDMDDDMSLSSSAPPHSYSILSKQFLHHHGRNLFSYATTWFLVDVVFYSSNLFQSHIYESFLPHDINKLNVFEHAYDVAKIKVVIAICSTILGYWFTVFFIDRIGRKKIQMIGFFLTSAFLLAIGVPYNAYWRGKKFEFLFIYGLTFFFCNFGPNTTTFIVLAELFPARFRTTCHGISGAAGKVGAIIGSIAFLWASHDKKMDGYPKGIEITGSLIILGAISLVGGVVTFFFTPETKGRSLEENEGDNSAKENHEANASVQP